MNYTHIEKDFQGIVSNDSEILRDFSEGKGVKIYEEITRKDAQVGGLIQQRIDQVLAMDREWICDNERNMELIKDYWENLSQFMAESAFAIVTGYQVFEPVYKGKLEFIQRRPEYFAFREDGTIMFDGELGWEKVTKPMIISRYGSGLYGKSIIESIYWMWKIKHEMVRLSSAEATKIANQIILFRRRFEDGISVKISESDEIDFIELMTDVVNGNVGAAIMPEAIDGYDIISDTSGRSGSLLEAVKYYDEQIAKGIMGQTATSQDAKGGLGGAQLAQLMIAKQKPLQLSPVVEKAVNSAVKLIFKTVFKIENNFPILRLKIQDKVSIEERKANMEIIEKIFLIGGKVSADVIEERTGIEVERIENIPQMKLSEEIETGNMSEDIDKTTSIMAKQLAEQMTEIRDYIEKVSSDKSNWEKPVKIPEKMIKKLHSTIGAHMIVGYFAGMKYIQDEYLKVERNNKKKLQSDLKLADVSDIVEGLNWANLTPYDAIEYFNAIMPIGNKEQVLSSSVDYGIAIGSEINATVVEKWGRAIQSSLEEGLTVKEFVGSLSNKFNAWGITPQRPYQLETIYRTNISISYNAGADKELNTPFMKNVFPAYLYSAVGDSNTTDFCRLHNGAIYDADDPFWNYGTPPNHYNCRSEKIPINKYRTFETEQTRSLDGNILRPQREFDRNFSEEFNR